MKASASLFILFFGGVVTPLAIVNGAESVKDFTLPSATDSSLVRLSDYSGKVVLLHWWRTSCGYCQREEPKVVALEKKYRADGLVIIGVSDDTADTAADIPAYLKRYAITWPIVLNDQGEFMREIVSQGRGETPCNYVVSRSGELSFLGLDREPEDWLKVEKTVGRLLAEPKPNKPAIRSRELGSAPPFSLPDLKGKNVGLKDFAGKPLVVNFFNVESSDYAGAVLSRLHRDYAKRGLQVIGINLFDENAEIQKCIEKHKIQYTVVRGDETSQTGWIGSSSAWATFFVNSEGKIVKKIVNSIDNGIEEQVFRKYAENLLAKP